jgi:cobaltochelatase CobN
MLMLPGCVRQFNGSLFSLKNTRISWSADDIITRNHPDAHSRQARRAGSTMGAMLSTSLSSLPTSCFCPPPIPSLEVWQRRSRLGRAAPSLRLANLMALSHPYSVDLYAEQTLRGSRIVILRFLAVLNTGATGWSGLLKRRASGIDLVVIPGDDKWDAALTSHSTRGTDDVRRMWRYLRRRRGLRTTPTLRFAGHLLGLTPKSRHPPRSSAARRSFICLVIPRLVLKRLNRPGRPGQRRSLRSPSTARLCRARQTAPVDALVSALAEAGVNALPVFVSSLKEAESIAVLDALFEEAKPDVVLNGLLLLFRKPGSRTSRRRSTNGANLFCRWCSRLRPKRAGRRADQGLSIRDLAMHVVLPEIDGRLLTRAVSFKEEGVFDAATQSTPVKFTPVPDRMWFVAELAAMAGPTLAGSQ